MSVFENVREIFMAAQRNSASHTKGAQKLKQMALDKDINLDEFILALKKCVHATLEIDYKVLHPFADKAIVFIAGFCVVIHDHHIKHVDPETDSGVLTKLVEFLIVMSNMESNSHRYRSCQLLSKIFNGLVGYDLTAEFCSSVQDCLLTLMDDRLAKVRIQAAEALAAFQEPQNNHCPIIAAYIHHMAYDPKASVRRICAAQVALSRETVPHLVDSSQDIDLTVKLAVYKRAAKYPSRFKIVHKQDLINSGKRVTQESFKQFMSEVLVTSWLQYNQMNYLKLLSVLRLDSTWENLEKTCEVSEYVITSLFEIRPTVELMTVLKMNDKNMLDFVNLNYDTALYWRFLVQHLRKKNGANEAFAPQLPDLCDYIQKFCDYTLKKDRTLEEHNANLEYNFIVKQLFTMALGYDYVDVNCKNTMTKLIGTLLKSYSFDLEVVNEIILNLNIVMPDVYKQATLICDITGELMYETECNATKSSNREVSKSSIAPISPDKPMNSTQADYAIAGVKIKCIQLESDLDEAVKNQDFLKASELKPQLDNVRHQLSLLLSGNREQDATEEEETCEIQDEHDEGEEGAPREHRQDPVLMKKVLTIMAGYLTSSKIKKLNTTLQTFKMNVIDDCIQSDNMSVKIIAMRCLALCCSLDEHTAKMAIPICIAIIFAHNRSDHAQVPADLVINCLGAVIDSLIRFGTKLVVNTSSQDAMDSVPDPELEVFTGGITLTGIISEMLQMLNDENAKIQELAGRGTCNFIVTSRIYSHAVISRLIVKYVTPTSAEYESIKLQQLIGATLGNLPLIPNSATQLEKAIIPSLKIILDAPPNSPLATVDVDHVAKLLIELCAQFENGFKIQRNLFESFVKEIREKPNNANNKTYTKVLLLLKFSGEDKEDLQQICTLLDDLRDTLRDPKLLTNIIKLNTKITLLMNANEEAIDSNAENVQITANSNTDNDSSNSSSNSDDENILEV